MASETPFSFHCIICFEEFHHEDRYPVVLPCGHTYVCHICAKKLDKCMECRTPLYTLEKKPPDGRTSPLNVYVPYSSRRVRNSPETVKPTPPVKKRLPLPKNVVLLSLIQATELATEGAQKKFRVSPKGESSSVRSGVASPSFESIDSKETKEEEDEEERIKMSTSLALGKSGTYAVAVHEGLEIFPSRQQYVDDDASTTHTEDVESMVRHFHLDQSTDEEVKELARLPSCIVKENARLQYGDRVQIVSIDGGWAKLARGYGFVKADKRLVKVGGSVDVACKMEALLRFLSKQRKDLRLAQTKIDNQFIQVLNELQVSLKKNEDLTVICGATFNSPDDEISPSESRTSNSLSSTTDNVARRPLSARSGESDDDFSFVKPKEAQVETEPTLNHNRFMCFANGFLEEDGPSLPRLQLLPANSIMANLPWSESQDSASPRTHRQTSDFASSRPSDSELRAGAIAWRERHGREASKGTDFRTGMSGHMGLSQGNEYLGQSRATASYPRMSSHTGLSVRSPTFRRSVHSRTAHPRLSSFGHAQPRNISSSYTLPYAPEPNVSHIPNSGSF